MHKYTEWETLSSMDGWDGRIDGWMDACVAKGPRAERKEPRAVSQNISIEKCTNCIYVQISM